MSARSTVAPGPEDGARGPLLAVLVRRSLGPGAPERYAIRQPEVAIGRVEGNDVVVSDPSVSARHARLRLAGGVWTLADLGSVNGSQVDGEPVQAALPLAPGSLLRLGSIELVFAPHDRWADSPAPAAPSPAPFELELPTRQAIPLPVLIGLAVIALGLVGYFLTRGG